MLKLFDFFSRKIRLANPWRYKVPCLMAAPYFMMLTGNIDSVSAFVAIAFSFSTIIGLAGIAYLFNDASDAESDRIAGKDNPMFSISNVQVVLIGGLFAVLAIGPWFWFPWDRWSFMLLGSELTLFYLYAFRPFRLKERGWAGVIADALYAHLIPGVLAAYTFYLLGGRTFPEMNMFLVLLCVWQFFVGVRNILWHQLSDEQADRASGVRTLVTRLGPARIKSIRGWFVLPLECLSFLAYAWFINGFINWFLAALGVFLVITFLSSQENRNPTVDRFTNAYIDDFYIRWFPVLILSAMTLLLPELAPVLLVHLVLFRNGITPLINKAWKNALQAFRNLNI